MPLLSEFEESYCFHMMLAEEQGELGRAKTNWRKKAEAEKQTRGGRPVFVVKDRSGVSSGVSGAASGSSNAAEGSSEAASSGSGTVESKNTSSETLFLGTWDELMGENGVLHSSCIEKCLMNLTMRCTDIRNTGIGKVIVCFYYHEQKTQNEIGMDHTTTATYLSYQLRISRTNFISMGPVIHTPIIYFYISLSLQVPAATRLT
jgi:hypothetical protein